MLSEYQNEDRYTLLPRAVEGVLRRGFGRIFGAALLAAIAVSWLSLVTWSVTDPSLTHATREAATNLLGYPGAVISDLMLQTFGLASALLLLAPMFWGLELVTSGAVSGSRWKVLSYAASVLSLAGALSIVPKFIAWPLNHGYGGIVGDGIAAVAKWGFAQALPDYAGLLGFVALLACGAFFTLASLGVDVEGMRKFVKGAASQAKRSAERQRSRFQSSDDAGPFEPKLPTHQDRNAGSRAAPRAEPDNNASRHSGPRRYPEPSPGLRLPQGPASERHWREPAGVEGNDFRHIGSDGFEAARRGTTAHRETKRAREPEPEPEPSAASNKDHREQDFVPAFGPDDDEIDHRGIEFDSDTDADSFRIAKRFAPRSPSDKGTGIRNVLRAAALQLIDPDDGPAAASERKLPADAAAVVVSEPTEYERAPHHGAPAAEERPAEPIGDTGGIANVAEPRMRIAPQSAPGPQVRGDSASDAAARSQQRPQPKSHQQGVPRKDASSQSGPLNALPRNANGYRRPSLNLLQSSPAARPGPEMTQAVLRGTARLLEDVLERFGVNGEICDIRPGPVVTAYEVHLEKGTNPLRAVGLADDIGRAMNAGSVRVAVLPAPTGAGIVIEIPNVHRHRASLRDLLSGESYRSFGGSLPVALGLSTGGQPIVADLAQLSNLLIAGRENSGKSTCLRSMLLSLIFRNSAEDCRFVLFDPKLLEFGCFNGVAQLLCPVLSETEKMMAALDWIVEEMDERAKRMAKLSARSLEIFNNRVRNAKKRGEMIARTVRTGFCERTGQPIYEHEQMEFEPMPHIVVAIDELSELMSAAPRECEAALLRIAEKGRGVGVHLVAATKTTTGLCLSEKIRVAMASAIAFKLGSKVDSRLVLGEQGAEQLLDQGDAILATGPGRTTRLHTPFVSQDEVEAVAASLRAGGPSRYAPSLMARLQDACEPYSVALAAEPVEDPLMPPAAE